MLFFEIFITLLSPNYLLHSLKTVTDPFWYNIQLSYEINDFLIVIQFLKSYTLFRFLITCSRYYNARAFRVSKMMGRRLTRLFSIRCLLKKRPLLLLSILGMVFIMQMGYLIMVIESPSFQANKDKLNDYSKFENCLWQILVTITTGNFNMFNKFSRLW